MMLEEYRCSHAGGLFCYLCCFVLVCDSVVWVLEFRNFRMLVTHDGVD